MSPFREDDGKLLAFRNGLIKLYNLAEDIGEKNDLAAAPRKGGRTENEAI